MEKKKKVNVGKSVRVFIDRYNIIGERKNIKTDVSPTLESFKKLFEKRYIKAPVPREKNNVVRSPVNDDIPNIL